MFTFRSKKQKQDLNGAQGVRAYPSLPELSVSQGMKWPAGFVDVTAADPHLQPNELGSLKGPESPTTVRSARAVKTSFSADRPPAFHRPLWDAQNVKGKEQHPIGTKFGAGPRPPPSAYDKKAARSARMNPRKGKVAPTFNIMVRVVHRRPVVRARLLNTRFLLDCRWSGYGQDHPPSAAVRHSRYLTHCHP